MAWNARIDEDVGSNRIAHGPSHGWEQWARSTVADQTDRTICGDRSQLVRHGIGVLLPAGRGQTLRSG